jgi:hypothetical protein
VSTPRIISFTPNEWHGLSASRRVDGVVGQCRERLAVVDVHVDCPGRLTVVRQRVR